MCQQSQTSYSLRSGTPSRTLRDNIQSHRRCRSSTFRQPCVDVRIGTQSYLTFAYKSGHRGNTQSNRSLCCGRIGIHEEKRQVSIGSKTAFFQGANMNCPYHSEQNPPIHSPDSQTLSLRQAPPCPSFFRQNIPAVFRRFTPQYSSCSQLSEESLVRREVVTKRNVRS